ncbi:hypothetical protein GA0061099_100488 [Bradyrhizobium yuanmingense]|uniref:Uncharacterized protein n=1 Tax=Bradyrhizobium yuanmingense TaxID=108015 RepID=A0A1C3VJW4_9BRAD|nr:hypothetical protein [Bradyrhizobium yuanmingense]TWI28502.1 hypothetical protein IQ15_01847 [Bradyrhizobium yuanmingense]SCB27897.1 hypothetical protein GA0061099_100488 [Bradyrhizobium yuanmingense]
MAVTDLRDLVLEAHGAAQWQRFRKIEGDMSIVGALWARKGWPDALKNVRVTADIAEQQLSYEPFTADGLRSFYRPDLVAIDTFDGKRLKQRTNPRDAFASHTPATPWDDLHLAYFSGYAMWNYLNTPFMFALPGFAAEEIEPWVEGHESWRRLKITFPESIATHSPEQVFHVDGNGLIARLDYSANVVGGIPTAHYTSDYRDFAGIKIPTKRRAYRRNTDGTPIQDGVGVAIDISNVKFS